MWLWKLFLLLYCCLNSVEGRETQRFVAPTCFDDRKCRHSNFISPTVAVTATLKDEDTRAFKVVTLYLNNLVPNLQNLKLKPNNFKTDTINSLMVISLLSIAELGKCIKPVHLSNAMLNTYPNENGNIYYYYEFDDIRQTFRKRQYLPNTQLPLGTAIVREDANGEDSLIGLTQNPQSHILQTGQHFEHLRQMKRSRRAKIRRTKQRYVVPIVLKYQHQSAIQRTATFISFRFALTVRNEVVPSFDQLHSITFHLEALGAYLNELDLPVNELTHIPLIGYKDLTLLKLPLSSPQMNYIEQIRYDRTARLAIRKRTFYYYCYITVKGTYRVVKNVVTFDAQRSVLIGTILATAQDIGSGLFAKVEDDPLVVLVGIIGKVLKEGSFQLIDTDGLYEELTNLIESRNAEMDVELSTSGNLHQEGSADEDVEMETEPSAKFAGVSVPIESGSKRRSSAFVAPNVALTGSHNFMTWSESNWITFHFITFPASDVVKPIEVKRDLIIRLQKNNVMVLILPRATVQGITIEPVVKPPQSIPYINVEPFCIYHVSMDDQNQNPVRQTIKIKEIGTTTKRRDFQNTEGVTADNGFRATDEDIGTPFIYIVDAKMIIVAGVIVAIRNDGTFDVEGVSLEFGFLDAIIALNTQKAENVKNTLNAIVTYQTVLQKELNVVIQFFETFKVARMLLHFQSREFMALRELHRVLLLESSARMKPLLEMLQILRPYFDL